MRPFSKCDRVCNDATYCLARAVSSHRDFVCAFVGVSSFSLGEAVVGPASCLPCGVSSAVFEEVSWFLLIFPLEKFSFDKDKIACFPQFLLQVSDRKSVV